MIIVGKGNRQSNEPVDPRKRFEFNTPEKRSRIPVYFALLLTGLAAFLKNAFAMELEDGTPSDQHGQAQDRGRAPRNEPDEPVLPAHSDNDLVSGGADNSILPLSDPWPKGFVMTEPVSFSYTAHAFDFLGPQVAPFFPAAFNYSPQNDNMPPALPRGREPSSQQPAHIAPVDVVVSDRAVEDDLPESPDKSGDRSDVKREEPTPGQANRAPVTTGPVRLHDVFAGQVMLIGLSELLFGAADPDGDVLTINDLSASGGILLQIDDGWSFAPVDGPDGFVTFTYAVSDGLLDIVQTAVMEVRRHVVQLTPDDDHFVGTPWDDDVRGMAGDDFVDVGAGHDMVDGGAGEDEIYGGDGDDYLFGGAGDDVIFGGAGDDIISGGRGDDYLFGEDGDDIIFGDAGNDLIFGGAGDDFIDGGDGDDFISGGRGRDTLIGSAGDDVIRGGRGDDHIEGNDGQDTLRGNSGRDFIDGGDGDDTLFGGAGDDILYGGNGDDEIYGGRGNDLISGGCGDDEIYGGRGNDIILGDAGYDLIDGGAGHDILDYSAFSADLYVDFDAGFAFSDEVDEDHFRNIEEVIGGSGNDTFVLGASAAIISGGRGNDVFIFTVNDETPALSRELVFRILDFVVGDRIYVADYEISHRAERLEEERFGDIYDALDDGFEANLPIRVRHSYYDDMHHTIIEADFDRNDFYEISITLDNVQLPLTINSHFA